MLYCHFNVYFLALYLIHYLFIYLELDIITLFSVGDINNIQPILNDLLQHTLIVASNIFEWITFRPSQHNIYLFYRAKHLEIQHHSFSKNSHRGKTHQSYMQRFRQLSIIKRGQKQNLYKELCLCGNYLKSALNLYTLEIYIWNNWRPWLSHAQNPEPFFILSNFLNKVSLLISCFN